MKIHKFLTIILGLLVIMAGICYFNTRPKHTEIWSIVAVQRAPAHNTTPVLDVRSEVVKENLQEWCQPLEVVDSVVEIPSNNISQQSNNIVQYKEESVVKEQQQYYEEGGQVLIQEENYDNYNDNNFSDIFNNADDFMSEWEFTTQDVILDNDDITEIETESINVNNNQSQMIENNSFFGEQIVDYAMNWVGVTPYVSWYDRDESSLAEGTDCSGFVSLIYGEFGIEASAASDDYQYLSNINYDELMAGDIVVYRNGGHVGIYAGEDMIIHCANEEMGTIYGDMWYQQPTGYVRLYDYEEIE